MKTISRLENWGPIFKRTPVWVPKRQHSEEYLVFCSLHEQIEAELLKLLLLKSA